MFIIKEGNGYKVVDGKAYKIDFDKNGQIIVTDKETKIDGNETLYSYDEMYRKLNIAYFANFKIVEVEPEKEPEKEPELEQNPDEGANNEPEDKPEEDTLKEAKKSK